MVAIRIVTNHLKRVVEIDSNHLLSLLWFFFGSLNFCFGLLLMNNCMQNISLFFFVIVEQCSRFELIMSNPNNFCFLKYHQKKNCFLNYVILFLLPPTHQTSLCGLNQYDHIRSYTIHSICERSSYWKCIKWKRKSISCLQNGNSMPKLSIYNNSTNK